MSHRGENHSRKRLRTRVVSFEAVLVFLILGTVSARIPAAEITVFQNQVGQTVDVNSQDRELRDSVKRGGVSAGLRVIYQRKSALDGIDQFIEQISLEQRLDARLVRAIIQVESAWNVLARSNKGALGLMQLMPRTASRFGVRDPFDARDNIRGGTRYLRFLLDRFSGDLNFSLAAYNAGEKAVDTWGAVPPYKETQTYLRHINLIFGAMQQEARLSATAISRTRHDNRVIYTNLD